MSLVKVEAKHRITIPKPVAEALQLKVGETLELGVRNGKAMIVLKRVAAKQKEPKLTAKDTYIFRHIGDHDILKNP